MKEKVTFSIDEEIMKLVREHIPNASKFAEDCFKAHFKYMTENDEERGEELRKAWEDFHVAKMKIHMLTSINYKQMSIEKMQEETLTNAWLNVWADYRRTESTQDYKIEESAKVLNLETDVLKQLLHDTYLEAKMNMTKLYIFDEWKYIEENILPHVEVDDEEFDLDAILGD